MASREHIVGPAPQRVRRLWAAGAAVTIDFDPDLGARVRRMLGRRHPVADFNRGTRIGAAWITRDVKGRQVTWHNGGTGGFRSWLGLDRQAGTAVVLLSATAVPVDGSGFRLLQQLND